MVLAPAALARWCGLAFGSAELGVAAGIEPDRPLGLGWCAGDGFDHMVVELALQYSVVQAGFPTGPPGPAVMGFALGRAHITTWEGAAWSRAINRARRWLVNSRRSRPTFSGTLFPLITTGRICASQANRRASAAVICSPVLSRVAVSNSPLSTW